MPASTQLRSSRLVPPEPLHASASVGSRCSAPSWYWKSSCWSIPAMDIQRVVAFYQRARGPDTE